MSSHEDTVSRWWGNIENFIKIYDEGTRKSMKTKKICSNIEMSIFHQKICDNKIVRNSELRSETLGISDLEGNYIIKFPM